jgi:monoamine oxidase
MEATLVRVSQTKDRVTATLVRRGRRSEWQGHYLVSATPASTLRDVVFRPALPEAQVVAVRKLEYGPATRALVQFERRFWRRGHRPVAFATNLSCGAFWDGNQEQRGHPGILSFLAGGSAARSLADLLTAEGPSGLLRKIRWLGRPANVLHAKVFRWNRDPWARGGYACFGPGFDPRWRDALALPFGRVVFAGEHTSIRWQGYMNGAVESGQRAAAEIESLAVR